MVCGSAHILHFSNQNKAHKRVHTSIRRVRLVSHRQFRLPNWSMGVFSLHLSSPSSPTTMTHGSFLSASDVLGWCLIVSFAYQIGPWEFSRCIRRVRLVSHRQFRLPKWSISHCIRRVRLCPHRQFGLLKWSMGVFSLASDVLGWCLVASFAYKNGPWEFSLCIRRVRLVSHRQFRLQKWSMRVFSLHQTC